MNSYFSVCVLVIEGYGWHGIEFHLSMGIVNKVGPRFIYSFLPPFLRCLLVFSVLLDSIRFDYCLGKHLTWPCDGLLPWFYLVLCVDYL